MESLYDMSQLMSEKTTVTHSTESTLDVILTTNPSLHKRSGVITKTLSDHYMIFTELSVPKKVLQDNHNTVTFRNYSRFDDCEFIDDIKSNDLLNGNCKDIKCSEWKNAFMHVSNGHAPIKTARLKVRFNTWITRNVVKLMYERDPVHELAVKRKDVLMENYSKLINTITGMIKNPGKWNDLTRSAIHCVQVIVRFGPSVTTSYQRLIWNQFPKAWELKILISVSKMFMASSLPRSLMTVLCYGRFRKVYILLNGPFTTFYIALWLDWHGQSIR